MRRLFYILVSSVVCNMFFSCSSSKSISSTESIEKITVDPKNVSPLNDGIFEGWGTSLCWWGNRLGEDDALSERAAEIFFSEEKGIGLNIVRYNIGGGDNPKHHHIVRTDSAMPGFWKNVDKSGEFDFDWDADGYQRKALRKILANANRKNLVVEFFSNSPPYFMTRSGCTSGSISGFSNNIRNDKYEDFAEYLAEVTFQIQQIEGIKVASLEPMNEPRSVSWSAFNPKQEGCRVNAGKSQSDLFLLTRLALDKKGLNDVLVSGGDEYGPALQANSFNKLSQEAKEKLGRINTHTYYGNDYEKLLNVSKMNNKNIWVSETDAPYALGKKNGQMGPALALAEKIIADMNGLKPSAWIMWQAVAEYVEKPDENVFEKSVVKKRNREETPEFFKPFWGTSIADFLKCEIRLSKKYFVFGQFTKFIRPGDYVIYTGRNDVLASCSPDLKRISVVCVNLSEVEKTVDLDLSLFGDVYGSVTAFRTSGNTLDEGENLEKVEVNIVNASPSIFSSVLMPYSVTSLVIE